MFQPEDKNFKLHVGVTWLCLFMLFYTCTAKADEWKLLDVEKLDVVYSKLDKKNRDPYAPTYTNRWNDRASLQWRVSILSRVYWDNDCHVETIDTGAVKTVGWHWDAGVRINKYFSVFQEHHSRHIMEETPEKRNEAGNQFPVENAVGLRVKLIEEKSGRSLFN